MNSNPILTFQFDSKESWHRWRKKGIGATDAAVILQASPYKTPYQLWAEKCGLVERDTTISFVMSKGQEFEPYVRELFATTKNIKVVPAWVEDGIFRCSLDGLYEQNGSNIPLEIKLVGREYFRKIKEGEPLREDHLIQVQMQIMLLDAPYGTYAVYNDELDEMFDRRVEPDYDLMNRIRSEGRAFWELVESKTAPELSDKDIVEIEEQALCETAFRYAEVKRQMDSLKKELTALEEALTKIVEPGKPSVFLRGAGVSITGYFRKGNVDYAKIPELNGVDLEKYRKKSSFCHRITI